MKDTPIRFLLFAVLTLLVTATETTDVPVCYMALIADYSFYQRHTSNTTTRMLDVISRADSFFRREAGFGLASDFTYVVQSKDDRSGLGKLHETKNVSDALDVLQRAVSSETIDGISGKRFCMVHMFTALPVSEQSIGIGFRPGMCRPVGLNTGLTTEMKDVNGNVLDDLYVTTVVHELGHAFGAVHDHHECKEQVDGKFSLMSSELPPDVREEQVVLSKCTKERMAQQINYLRDNNALCFDRMYTDAPFQVTAGYNLPPVADYDSLASRHNLFQAMTIALFLLVVLVS